MTALPSAAPADGDRDAQGRFLLSIQTLRGIAVLGVVVMHVSLYVTVRLGLTGAMPAFEVGAAGVDIFFVVSGFVMVYASERLFARSGSTRIFLLRRLARIAPMYWIATTILLAYLLIQYGSLAAATGGASWSYLLASYLFWPAVRGDGLDTPLLGVGWTLIYEAFFYVVFGLLIFLPRRAAAGATGGLLCALVLFALMAGPLPYPFGYWFSPIILEFVFGMGLALAYRAGIRIPLWLSILLLVAACAVLGWSWTQGHAFPPQAPLRPIVWGLPAGAIAAALTLARTPVRRNALSRMLAVIGDASYSIYLFHTLTLPLPRLVLARLIEPASAPWLHVACTFLFALVPGLFLYWLVEKPLTRALQRAIEPNRRSTPEHPGTPATASPP